MTSCRLCQKQINPRDPAVWQATSTWSRNGRARPGGSRGGSDRVVWRRHELYAHDACVQRLKLGLAGQEGLL